MFLLFFFKFFICGFWNVKLQKCFCESNVEELVNAVTSAVPSGRNQRRAAVHNSNSAPSYSQPYSSATGGEAPTCVHMRGLPYNSTEDDITRFFAGILKALVFFFIFGCVSIRRQCNSIKNSSKSRWNRSFCRISIISWGRNGHEKKQSTFFFLLIGIIINFLKLLGIHGCSIRWITKNPIWR